MFFKEATCVGLDVDYTQSGDSYATTKLIVQAQKLIVGNGIDSSFLYNPGDTVYKIVTRERNIEKRTSNTIYFPARDIITIKHE